MSLAMYAAPFDNDINVVNNKENESIISRKKNSNNRTQKRFPKENNYSEKVNSVLQTIHNLPPEDEHENSLSDFVPIPPPTSVGVLMKDSQQSPQIQRQFVGDPTNENMDYSSKSDNYERFIPNYKAMYNNVPYYNMPSSSSYSLNGGGGGDKNDVLIEKLNYMIHLLEEQQDERTNNVTEEVILYSFLGVFIIFIVDSFARVGKYVR